MNSELLSAEDDNRKRRRRVNFLIIMSLVSSSAVLMWSFYSSIRKANATNGDVPTAQRDLSPNSPAALANQRRSRADEFRAAAAALDDEFMRMVREKNQRPADLPGIDQSRQHWQRRVNVVKRQIAAVQDAAPGTMEWEYRREMLEAIEDGPE